ncbi:MAG: hypothetical protein ACPGVB_16775 [Chitinophagales bacterium]
MKFFQNIPIYILSLFFAYGCLFWVNISAQETAHDSFDKYHLIENDTSTTTLQSTDSIEVIASNLYHRSKFGHLFFGKHYRKEWETPIKVACLDITTAKGGLTPIKQGGGMQTKSLRFMGKDSVQYTFRSIDKDIGGALKPFLQDSFVENFLQDGISSAHPYGFLAIPRLAEAVGIYHTHPVVYYLPSTDYLEEYKETFGGMLGMLEIRPDEDLSAYPRFGRSKNVVSTNTVFEHLHRDQDHEVDRWMYARARLLDMIIGDWDRHQDQWRWAEFEKKDRGSIFRPVPRDRDQAFVQFEGVLPWLTTRKWAMRKMNHFGDKIHDVRGMTMQADDMDPWFLNQLTVEDWKMIADSVKQELTDEVIEAAVRAFPKEIFAISGQEIITKLKGRRYGLVDYATEFALIMAKQATIMGSDDQEWFVIERLNENQTSVKIYKMDGDGKKGAKLYERIFNAKETKEIHLYGLDGDDCFEVKGEVNKGINLFLQGGKGKDVLDDQSLVRSDKKNRLMYFENDKK